VQILFRHKVLKLLPQRGKNWEELFQNFSPETISVSAFTTRSKSKARTSRGREKAGPIYPPFSIFSGKNDLLAVDESAYVRDF
jgi:hypothetical protein